MTETTAQTPLGHWLQRLERLHPREIDLGLERVREVAEAMGLLPLPQPVVTVAGTNGKGSIVAVLEALVNASGRSAGAFNSPHIRRFNERIRVGGAEAGDAEIVEAFAAIEAARGGVSLTYFEFAALAALCVFRRRRPDVVILEVGLGGRLDAVNIVDPAVAVISAIDLDHQDWLGASRDAIAVEKAGILRAGVPAVIADPAPPQALLDSLERTRVSRALSLGRDFHWVAAAGGQGAWRGRLWSPQGGSRHLPSLPAGPLLPGNVCAALQVALLLGVEVDDGGLAHLLQRAAPSGRREWRQVGGREVLLDVAHNPSAVEKMLEYMHATNCKKRKIAVFSVMRDKDIDGMAARAARHFDAWFVAGQPDNSRAAQATDIAAALRGQGVAALTVCADIAQAVRGALENSAAGDTVVVFGSFFTVAGALPLLDVAAPGMEAAR